MRSLREYDVSTSHRRIACNAIYAAHAGIDAGIDAGTVAERSHLPALRTHLPDGHKILRSVRYSHRNFSPRLAPAKAG